MIYKYNKFFEIVLKTEVVIIVLCALLFFFFVAFGIVYSVPSYQGSYSLEACIPDCAPYRVVSCSKYEAICGVPVIRREVK
jgi:hypothetical protein